MEVHLGVGTPKPRKKLSVRYLLIFKKTSALAQAFESNCFFSGSIWEGSGGEYPKLCETFYFLNNIS